MLRTTPLTAPVLLLIFRRPDTTARVFEAIRAAKPTRLFVSADGPRGGRPEETERCRMARDLATAVDWDCELRTNFRADNAGCKLAVSGGIRWFFDHVDEGIILEDDCLPSQSFFCFCQELLHRYRDDERVMQISGANFQFGRTHGVWKLLLLEAERRLGLGDLAARLGALRPGHEAFSGLQDDPRDGGLPGRSGDARLADERPPGGVRRRQQRVVVAVGIRDLRMSGLRGLRGGFAARTAGGRITSRTMSLLRAVAYMELIATVNAGASRGDRGEVIA
jgi:hypothetical protein